MNNKMKLFSDQNNSSTLGCVSNNIITSNIDSNENNCPSNLLCEYMESPISIESVSPRFSWELNFNERGQSQTAYRILVSSNSSKLQKDIGDIWDSGKVTSTKSINIAYNGMPLISGSTYWWKVKAWDMNCMASQYSKKASFSMGLLNTEDWEGDWIGLPVFESKCAFLFRKELRLRKDISQARAYICGLGYYELWINNKKVGDHVLDPGNTNYSKRVLYVTYDVGEYLNNGLNAIGVILGDGWFGHPEFILQMNIEFDDGTTQTVYSENETWIAALSPITYNSIYGGEYYDSRFEKNGWNKAGFDFNGYYKEMYWRYFATIQVKPGQEINKEIEEYKNARYRTMLLPAPGGVLEAQMLEPIKVISEIIPVSISCPKPGIYVFDMGQNIAGWAKLKVEGPKGTIIKLRYSELLFEDGTINQEYLKVAYKTENCAQTDIYLLKGEGTEVYSPRFTYHGFRYVQVEGYPGEPDINDITGCIVRSSVKLSGEFYCSNNLINQIQNIILWTESCNLHSIPTDCPQRDERHGWLNDMTVRAEEAIYNFNMSRMYTKWMKDISDEQDAKTGAIPDTAPYRRGLIPADPVSSSYLIVPWLLYLHYGDIRILEQHYEGMKKWVEYLGRHAYDYIVGYSYWGDWASPINECMKDDFDPYSLVTPGELISTGCYYHNTVLLSKIANVLGEFNEEKTFTELGIKIKKAFNNKFFNRESNQYAKGSQASNAFALFLKLVPEDRIVHVVDNLVNDIVNNHNGHLSTGNICTKYLLEVLTEYGHVDIAYTIATQKTYPSWGYMIYKGATTVWERWEYKTGAAMNSHNHPMYGSISAWFYKYLAGINVDPSGVGFKKITFKPYIPGKLDYVNASLSTMRGMVQSNWKRSDDEFIYNVKVPVGSTAQVYVPIIKNSINSLIVSESGVSVWKNGKYTPQTSGIMRGERKDGYIAFETGSGSYCFKINYPTLETLDLPPNIDT